MTQSITNETIKTLLNRRSIRKFKPDPIDQDTVDTLESVAQHAASSQYLNDWSALRISDPNIKHELARIGNQTYIAQAPLLYVFVADERRNAAIAQTKGIDIYSEEFSLNASYHLVQSHNDAVLALHAMETAAYSLGLGCVILGSILNDINGVIDVLHLPEYTYPVLGLALGKPDQTPMLKPRLPKEIQFFDNTYPSEYSELTLGLAAFDEEVHHYYDLRQADRPVDAFSDQIAQDSIEGVREKRMLQPTAERQGFRFDK